MFSFVWNKTGLIFKRRSSQRVVSDRKPGLGAVNSRSLPHIKNNYRIEVKHVFLAIVYRGLCCEFFFFFLNFEFFAIARLWLIFTDIRS